MERPAKQDGVQAIRQSFCGPLVATRLFRARLYLRIELSPESVGEGGGAVVEVFREGRGVGEVNGLKK
jgi:hypothetical protein